MTKSELIELFCEKTNSSKKEAESTINIVFDSIINALINQNNRVEIRGFGTFSVKEYKGYSGRNPKTGEKIEVKEKKLPIFRVGKELKDMVNSVA